MGTKMISDLLTAALNLGTAIVGARKRSRNYQIFQLCVTERAARMSENPATAITRDTVAVLKAAGDVAKDSAPTVSNALDFEHRLAPFNLGLHRISEAGAWNDYCFGSFGAGVKTPLGMVRKSAEIVLVSP